MSIQAATEHCCLHQIRSISEPQDRLKQAREFFQNAQHILGKERILQLRKESSFDPQVAATKIKSSSNSHIGKAEALLYLNESLLAVLSQKVLEAFAKQYPQFPSSQLYRSLITSFASSKIFEILNSENVLSNFSIYYVLESLAAWRSTGNCGTLIHESVSPYFAVKEFHFYRA
jgi:hypothetical protein